MAEDTEVRAEPTPQVTFEPQAQPAAPDPRKGTAITIAGVLVIALVTAGLSVMIANVRRAEPGPLDFSAAGSIRSMRMVMTTTGKTADGQSVTMTMEGSFDLDAPLASMTMKIEDLTFETIMTSTHVLMKLPQEAKAGFSSSKPWLRAPLTDEVLALFRQGGGPMGLPDDPRTFFEQLSSTATEVRPEGPEVINGVSTTRYHLTLDVEQFVLNVPGATEEDVTEALKQFGGDTMPSKVWIGEDGLPRRQSFELSIEGGAFTTVIDYLDYNERVQITLPRESEIQDAPEGTFGESRSESCTATETGTVSGGATGRPSPVFSCPPSP